jgi:predicted phosphodiesterase
MKIKILHLSDFHFKADNLSQDVVTSSLSMKIEELCKIDAKPNLLIITGDIAFSGKQDEYKKAKEFIDKILKHSGIQIENVFIIPGNHDVDRSKIEAKFIKWWYSFCNESDLTDILTSADAFPKIHATTSAYFEFLQQYMSGKTILGKYGEYVAKIPFGDKGYSLKIVGLNSALFCGYEGDDQKKLALGLAQVNACHEQINKQTDIVITCVHHPFESFHNCEKPSLNLIQRISDIILSGHVHDPNNSFRRDGNSGETIFITSGAAFEKRTTQNGFNVIEIDSDTLVGDVVFYKYLVSEHSWIKNKDINHETDGIFKFDIKKNLQSESINSSEIGSGEEKESNTYMVVLDGKFDELNRERFEAIEIHLKTICKDLKVIIKKVEKSSIKIYFETSNDISKDIQAEIKKIDGLEIIEIKKTEEYLRLKANTTDKSVYHWKTFLKPEFSENIENPGATFTHSRADSLTLKDLFVSPNLKIISIGENAKEKVDKIVNAEKVLLKTASTPIKIVIYGSDSSGKTTLVRWWYEKYYEQGYIPILLSGN